MRGEREVEVEERKIVSQPCLHSIKNSVSHLQALTNPPTPPSTHTLIPLLLTASQGCPRLNVNPLFRVTGE